MTETDEDEAPHILVVDDDARLRQLLHRYLVQNGYFATTAADAAEAKATAKSMAFDLMVLDIMMPGQDGLVADRGAARARATCRSCCLPHAVRPRTGSRAWSRVPTTICQAVRAARAALARRHHLAPGASARTDDVIRFGPFTFNRRSPSCAAATT